MVLCCKPVILGLPWRQLTMSSLMPFHLTTDKSKELSQLRLEMGAIGNSKTF